MGHEKKRKPSPGKALVTLLKGRLPPPGLFPDALLDGGAALASARGRISTLTNVERLITTFRHKEPDHVPCCPVISGAGRRLVGINYREFATNPEATAKALIAGFEMIGGEALIPLLDLSVEAADWGQKMVYPEHSTPHPDYDDPCIRDVSDYGKLQKIKLSEAPRMQSLIKICSILVDRVGLHGLVTGFAFGPLGVLNMMRGADHLFRDCINYPREVMKALEKITEVSIECIEAQCDAGVQAVTLDTLFASWNGLSKSLWEKIEGPFARELARAARRKGCPVAVHNCGHGIYFDSQIKFMEPEVISFAHLPDDCASRKELKEKYGDQVVLLGHIGTPLLSHGTPHDVMEECRQQIDDLADGGGYILAPGCEYPPDAPLENAHAIVRAAALYG